MPKLYEVFFSIFFTFLNNCIYCKKTILYRENLDNLKKHSLIQFCFVKKHLAYRCENSLFCISMYWIQIFSVGSVKHFEH